MKIDPKKIDLVKERLHRRRSPGEDWREVGNGSMLSVDHEDKTLKVTVYKNGTILVQPKNEDYERELSAMVAGSAATDSKVRARSPVQRRMVTETNAPVARKVVCPDPRQPIIVDCSKIGKNIIGPTEWRGVQLSECGSVYIELFRSKKFRRGHNNLGELLAIIDACRRLVDGHLVGTGIRSDSRTAISWFTKRRIQSTLDKAECDEEFVKQLQDSMRWLESSAHGIDVSLWETREEGENPADFGRKS